MSVSVQPSGRFIAVNVTLRNLIGLAYQIQRRQIIGGPDWIGSERFAFDVEGKPGDSGRKLLSKQDTLRMVQVLLEDRFKLTFHRENAKTASYALVLARKDGLLASALRPSALSCAPDDSAKPEPSATSPNCSLLVMGSVATANGQTIKDLATALTLRLNTLVVDRTGLTGQFDFELNWRAPEPSAVDSPLLSDLTLGAAQSIQRALQEQLGLKLEPETTEANAFVIDHVEQPTPN